MRKKDKLREVKNMIVDYLNDEFEYEMEYEDFDRENLI